MTKTQRAGRRSVLAYSQKLASQGTVARRYKKWRVHQGLAERCDNSACRYHSEPLVWNRTRLPVILDHREGNRRDNRPEMLRYLCPNCDSQLETRGGANRGCVRASEDGFVILSRDGRRAYTYFGTARIRLGGDADVQFTRGPAAE